MPSRFAANISTMFAEYGDLPERYTAAKKFGFSGVECQFPYDCRADRLKEARDSCGLEHVLMNSYKGSTEKEFGFALENEKSFVNSLDVTLKYANMLQCKRVHVIAGICMKNSPDFQVKEKNYIHNLELAAHMFQRYDILGLIEPLCKEVKADYFLSSFTQAIEYLKVINNPNLKLQMDIFHLQMIHGNLYNNLKFASPYIGHVQISQAPNRNEPNADGEINYRYILSVLDAIGYDGWVGLEYYPSGSTEESLSWIEEYGYNLN